MIYKATNLIAETFDLYDVDYRITEENEVSSVDASFNLESGQEIVVRFISDDEGNNVAIRIFGLVRNVPVLKRAEVMEICSALCAEGRYFKIYLHESGCVNVEADLPARINDDCLGECSYELFARLARTIVTEFHRFKEVMLGKSERSLSNPLELLRVLNELRDQPYDLKK